jgi:hypothetical protein
VRQARCVVEGLAIGVGATVQELGSRRRAIEATILTQWLRAFDSTGVGTTIDWIAAAVVSAVTADSAVVIVAAIAPVATTAVEPSVIARNDRVVTVTVSTVVGARRSHHGEQCEQTYRYRRN